jgi:hypothetical protein
MNKDAESRLNITIEQIINKKSSNAYSPNYPMERQSNTAFISSSVLVVAKSKIFWNGFLLRIASSGASGLIYF